MVSVADGSFFKTDSESNKSTYIRTSLDSSCLRKQSGLCIFGRILRPTIVYSVLLVHAIVVFLRNDIIRGLKCIHDNIPKSSEEKSTIVRP
mgnify:CR=1 FL=1